MKDFVSQITICMASAIFSGVCISMIFYGIYKATSGLTIASAFMAVVLLTITIRIYKKIKETLADKKSEERYGHY